MSMATFNSSTFNPGDTIYFSDKGGAYSTHMNPPSSGTAGNLITYMNAPGESPVLGPQTNSSTILVGVSYAIISGFTTTCPGGYAEIAGATNFSNTTISYITMNGGGAQNIIMNVAMTNVTFDHITVNTPGTSIAIYLYHTGNSNTTISNSTLPGSWNLQNHNGLIISNCTNTGTAGGISILNSTGVLTINGLTLSTTGATGLSLISGNTFSAGSLISNTTVSGVNGTGFALASANNVNLTNCVATNNVSGFSLGGVNTAVLTSCSSSGSTNTELGINSGSTNITINDFTAGPGTTNGVYIDNASYVTFNNSIIHDEEIGVWQTDGANHITFNHAYLHDLMQTGFTDNGTGDYDNTWNYSLVSNCGTYEKTHSPAANDDTGFAIDGSNGYNYAINYSIVTGCAAGGYHLGRASSGTIYNSVAYGNGGNWTGTGGVNNSWGAFSGYQTGLNPITGVGWTVKNSIGMNNYPVENVQMQVYNVMDNNLYEPTSNSAFATVGGNTVSWTTYNITDGYEPHSINANPLFTNASGSYSTSTDFSLQPLSPAIDTGTPITGLTTDILGNPIYGPSDIGAYAYQPPYTFAANKIPTTGSIRLYSNGQYRTLTATSSSATATFSVAPVGGFYTASTSEYLDLSINTWTTLDKNWNASSTASGIGYTHATSTVYTIGDLTPNTPYAFSLDGSPSTALTSSQCSGNICTSDGTGTLIFTYTGGNSSHTFNLSAPPTITSVSTVTSPSTDKTPSFSFTSSEAGTLLSAGSCTPNTTSVSSGSNSFTFNSLADGTYSNYAFSVIDSFGNDSATTTLNSFLIDTTGPTGSISNGSGSPTNQTTPTLNLTIADTGVGVTGAEMRFSCNGSTWSSWAAYATPVTTFNIDTGAGCTNSDGTKTVYVQFEDSLLNIGSAYNTGTFTLDTTNPNAALSNTPATYGIYTASTTTDIAVAGTDVVNYEYKLDSGSI
ncbi:MAG: right-handed parallel beta-helix repeat-containing protein [Syntrophobacteraceae bacterium]|jgi:hypothetical protein